MNQLGKSYISTTANKIGFLIIHFFFAKYEHILICLWIQQFHKAFMEGNLFNSNCKEEEKWFLYMCLSFYLISSLDLENKTGQSPVRY